MGGLENNKELIGFAKTLEETVIELVESGIMTKDLAISKLGKNDVDRKESQNTEEFIGSVKKALDKKIKIQN